MPVPILIDKVAWVRVENGKVLTARSHGRTRYYLPGGKREGAESDSQTLSREVREELSVELILGTAHYLGAFEAQADAKPPGVHVRIRCYECEYRGTLAPAAEIAEIAWLGYSGKLKTSAVDHLVFDWLHKRGRL